MNKKLIGASLAVVPLAALGGFVAANPQVQSTQQPAPFAGQGYTCPVTGEELVCPKCCVLNQSHGE